MRTARRAAPGTPAGEWGRGRLLAALAGAALTLVVLAVGLVLAVRSVMATAAGDPGAPPAPSPAAPQGSQQATLTGASLTPVLDEAARRDAIAAAPMLSVRPQDARPAAPAAVPAPPIEIPPATAPGPAGVPTGFPPTPAGALGQLAAIEVTLLQAMSIPATNQVYAAWATPGGVGVAGWEMTKNVQAFLGAAGMGTAKSATATVIAVPAGAQIKGSDGSTGNDWVLACVLVQVRASIRVDAQIGYGHCERMTWQAGRWLIGPGPAPARAPSTWPGTDVAARAGWLTWVDQGAR